MFDLPHLKKLPASIENDIAKTEQTTKNGKYTIQPIGKPIIPFFTYILPHLEFEFINKKT